MALILYSILGQATVEARYTAAEDTELVVGNSEQFLSMCWMITTDDDLPTASPSDWPRIHPGRSISIALKAGERLWLAHPNGAAAAQSASIQE